ncbi:MAG: hypothetical protein ACOX0H_02635 [Patescibacteria group bacterium]|jgi:hypothetical protein|nr:hypothetical protein [bacterium]
MKKIFICTTFREFDGSENDKIQRMFLNSLKNQTYKNWELIVTIFHEKNVETVLNELNIPSKLFYNKNDNYRFSLTEVFENCVNSIKKEDEGILIWTTCDVVFDNNFFETIVDNYKENYCGTSHPHFIFKDIESFKNNKKKKECPAEGIDTIFFDANIFLDDKNFDIIKKYRSFDWGLFEHFLVGLGKISASEMINIYGVSNIKKILNDRFEDAPNFLEKSFNKNIPTLKKFFADYNLPKSYLNLTYCNWQFKLLNKKKFFCKYSLFYIKRCFKKIIYVILRRKVENDKYPQS